jgi:hypothetical protein
MSNYWPLVMWMGHVNGKEFIYIPSAAHAHVHRMGPFKTWAQAMDCALRHLQVQRKPESMLAPVFMACVLEQDERPVTLEENTLRMVVRRISLGVDEGDEGYSSE